MTGNEINRSKMSSCIASIYIGRSGDTIGRSLLHTKMKSLMNTSAGDYIRHKRIQKACEMITQGHNVSETAYSCGFSDPNYFSKVFKKMVGVAPSDYVKP